LLLFLLMSGTSDVPIYGVHIRWADGDERVFAFSGRGALVRARWVFHYLTEREREYDLLALSRLNDGEWVTVRGSQDDPREEVGERCPWPDGNRDVDPRPPAG
jgi:hypothetical protein